MEDNENRMTKRVGIIGAGLSGLSAGRSLKEKGFHVSIFDKARSVGGRISTRRDDKLNTSFDHGAQYFTARESVFQQIVAKAVEQEALHEWSPKIAVFENGNWKWKGDESVTRYVGTPGMSSFASFLSKEVKEDLHFNTLISTIVPIKEEGSKKWQLISDKGEQLGTFDILVCAIPPTQAVNLFEKSPEALEGDVTNLIKKVKQVAMNPCWALLLSAQKQELPLDFDGAFVNSHPISWIARNNTKPFRNSTVESWVVHMSKDWSTKNLEKEPELIKEEIISILEQVIGKKLEKISYASAHRWRYATPEKVLEETHLWSSADNTGFCGDWCGGPRVEGAFMSGHHLSETISTSYRCLL